MLYAIFFDSKGPVLQIPVPKGSSVTGMFYKESVLTQLVDFYQKRRPRTGVRGIKLLHDNATAHKSATVESRCGIGSAVYQCLQHIPKEDYREAFQKWVDRCKMCVEADGAYFEGLK